MKQLWLYFGLIVLSIALDAIGDALRDKRKLKLSHLFEAGMIAAFLALVLLYKDVRWQDHLFLIVLYIVNRIFLFDIIYNKVKGNSISYIGDNSYYDDFFKLVLKKANPNMLMWSKFVLWVTVSGAYLFN